MLLWCNNLLRRSLAVWSWTELGWIMLLHSILKITTCTSCWNCVLWNHPITCYKCYVGCVTACHMLLIAVPFCCKWCGMINLHFGVLWPAWFWLDYILCPCLITHMIPSHVSCLVFTTPLSSSTGQMLLIPFLWVFHIQKFVSFRTQLCLNNRVCVSKGVTCLT